jgi:hypothetical protein
MIKLCACGLADRQWDPLSGRCLTCQLHYHDKPLREPLPGEHTLMAVGRAVGIIPPEHLTADNLTAEHYLKKTWSVVADKMGGHWHATVRVGQEGSRALCGRLQFDLSDVADVRDRLYDVSDRLVDETVAGTITELGEREVFRYGINGLYLAELTSMISSKIRGDQRALLIERLTTTFGIRVDLAKVSG